MKSVFNKIYSKTIDNAYEILIVGSVLFLLVFGLYKYFGGSDGTWTTKKYYEQIDIKEPVDTGKYINNQFVPPPVEKKDSSGETECRRVLTKIFGKPFLKARPDFFKKSCHGKQLQFRT